MRMRRSATFLAWALVGASAAAAAAAPGTGLVAVSPTRPGILRELERLGAPIASYDPETGVAYVVADASVEARLVRAGLAVATVEPDLDRAGARITGSPDLGLYHTWIETAAELESLHARYPALTRLEELGRSIEGRPILALKISDEPERDDASEPDVLVVGCHHAREFMSVEVPLHLARSLLGGYGLDPRLTRLVDGRELWVVPLLNPDGHVYQEEFQASPEWHPPGWRKNRRQNDDGTVGVDLNRNYAFLWGYDDEGSAPDGVSETFRGTEPFSEPETRALQLLVERQRFVVALSYHSFGGLLLYPWGYTRMALTEDQPVFEALADSMVRENRYRPGNAYFGTIYITNGDFDDWMYGEISPRKPTRTLPFTVELNSQGQGGFWPPEHLIAPTCEAMWSLNLYALQVAENARAPLPPPAPLLVATQDAQDRRRIHLEWTQPQDPGNPVDYYEVFEISPVGWDVAPPPLAAEATAAGRFLVARDLQRPRSDEVALRLRARLEPLWDHVYVEARGADGRWRALPGAATRSASPTGRNTGNGMSGVFEGRLLRFRLDGVPGTRFDLALRLDPFPGGPPGRAMRAVLDLPATYREERRVIVPHLRDTRYDVLAERGGLLAYGVTAVDVHGQRTDSEIFFFAIPEVAVTVADLDVRSAGSRVVLSGLSAGTARFAAWSRPAAAGERPAGAAAEWARADYRRAGRLDSPGAGPFAISWTAAPGTHVVLLEGNDADGQRIWGPWTVAVRAAVRLAPPVPNPANPTTTLEYETAAAGPVRLDVLDVGGRRVRTLVDGARPAGVYRARWDGRDDRGRTAATGLYLVRLAAGGVTRTERLVLLK